MDNQRIASELLKVAKDLTADDLTIISDVFARYLIGDRDQAVKQLNSLKKRDFAGDLSEIIESREYSEIFSQLQQEMLKVLKRNLPI
tara:strand:- start:4603 stop:4863 length:261 start_codon:yes stop_codon:yes gene_type:complete